MTLSANVVSRYLHGLPIPIADDVSDRQLLQQFAAAKNEAAFAELVRRHASLVLGICRRALGDLHEAEDAFQATFLVLAQKASVVQWHQSIAGWLHAVAYRTARKVKRKRMRFQRFELLREDSMPIAQLDCTVESDLRAVLEEEIQSLPRKHRLPIVVCYLQGKTNVEAAQELDCPVGTLKTRLSKARQLLRARLTRRGVTWSMGSLLIVLAEEASLAAPVALTNATVQIGIAAAHGKLAASSFNPSAWPLSKEVIQTMFVEKLKTVLLVTLLMVLVVGGAGAALFRAKAQPPPVPQRSAQASAPDKPLDDRAVGVDRLGDPLPADALRRIGKLRFRHGNSITDVKVSPDGKTLASGGRDKAVRHWDLKSGKLIRSFKHEKRVNTVSFSPDGKMIAAGDHAGHIVLWSTATGKEIRRLRVFTKNIRYVLSIVIAPDGETLACGDCAGRVSIWSVKSGKMLAKTESLLLRSGTAGVAFSKDGRILAACDRHATVHVLNVKTAKPVRAFKVESLQRSVSAFALSPDGKSVALGATGDDELRVVDVASGRETRRLKGKFGFTSVAFLPDGKTLVAGGQDGTAILWRADTGKELRRFQGHRGWVTSVAAAPDGKTVACAAEGLIRTWDAATGKELVSPGINRTMVWSVALAPNGKRLATADAQRIRFRDPASGKSLGGSISHPGRDRIAYSPDGKILFASCWDGKIRFWDAVQGKEIRTFDGYRGPDAVALSPNGKLLACGGSKGTIRLYDTATGETKQTLYSGEMVSSLAFSPDGKTLASGSWLKSIHLWSIPDGKLMRILKGHQGAVYSVVFSPDGKRLASSSCQNEFIVSHGNDTMIRLWDVATGSVQRTFGGSPGGYYQLKFSRDGRTLVSAGEDGQVRLWETETGKQRQVLTGHWGPVLSVEVADDGRTIYSGSADTTVLIWDASGLRRRASLADQDLKQQWPTLWERLADADASIAYRALWDLASAGDSAVAKIAENLGAAQKIDPAKMRMLIAELGDTRFAVRARAQHELALLGRAAEPFLKASLTVSPSLEARTRIKQLLDRMTKGASPKRLREMRAIELLERLATQRARRLLSELAKGGPEFALTQDARSALKRIDE